MPYSASIGEVAAFWLDRTADAFTAIRDIVFDVPARYGNWQAEPGSAAETELATDVFGDEVANRLVQLQRAVGSLHLRSASEYLAGVAALFRQREVHLNPGALTRSAFETAIRGFHVVDPRATLRQRCARSLLQELVSTAEFRKATKHLAGETHPAYVAADGIWKQLKERGEAAFPGAVVLSGGASSWLIDGEGYPRMNDAAEEWSAWRDQGQPDATLQEGEAEGYYDFLCLHTHPQSFAGHQAIDWLGTGGTSFTTDLVELAKLVLVTAVSVLDLARVLYDYHGWEAPELDQLAAELRYLWPDTDDLGEPDAAETRA